MKELAAQINMYQAKVFFVHNVDKLIQVRYRKEPQINSRDQKKIQRAKEKRADHERKRKDSPTNLMIKININFIQNQLPNIYVSFSSNSLKNYSSSSESFFSETLPICYFSS